MSVSSSLSSEHMARCMHGTNADHWNGLSWDADQCHHMLLPKRVLLRRATVQLDHRRVPRRFLRVWWRKSQ